MHRPTMRKRTWHELDLYCRLGLGLELIAPQVCRLARSLVGAEAAALFWLNEEGMPAGFFHENSPPEVQELFLNEFDRLFVGGAEVNVNTLARSGPKFTGQLLDVDRSYFLSNSFNLLVRPSGHFHTLDLRVDARGKPRAVLLLFRAERNPFSAADADRLSLVRSYLARAIGESAGAYRALQTLLKGHLVLRGERGSIEMASGEADAILRACTLVGQGVSLRNASAAPDFLVSLHRSPARGRSRGAYSLPSGRLEYEVEPIFRPGPSDDLHTIVSLELKTPEGLAVVDRIRSLDLTPTQERILLLSTQMSRSDAKAALGLSNEALKKHLAIIYRELSLGSWEELSSAISSAFEP